MVEAGEGLGLELEALEEALILLEFVSAGKGLGAQISLRLRARSRSELLFGQGGKRRLLAVFELNSAAEAGAWPCSLGPIPLRVDGFRRGLLR